MHPPETREIKTTNTPQDHHFLLGQSFRQFTSGSPIEPYASWIRAWPDADLIRYHSFLNRDAVLVVSPEAHRQILQTNCYAFTKPAWYRRLIFPIVGRGLVFLDGEEHRLHRKVLSGMLRSPVNSFKSCFLRLFWLAWWRREASGAGK